MSNEKINLYTSSYPIINIFRYRESIYGTFGILIYENIFKCNTLELPWYDNQPNISCIPPGIYFCSPFLSGYKFKNVYHIHNVPNRSWILIHNGSYAGDRTLHMKSHTHGCILIGFKKTATMIYQSRLAVSKFWRIMNKKSFILIINDLVHKDIQPIVTVDI